MNTRQWLMTTLAIGGVALASGCSRNADAPATGTAPPPAAEAPPPVAAAGFTAAPSAEPAVVEATPVAPPPSPTAPAAAPAAPAAAPRAPVARPAPAPEVAKVVSVREAFDTVSVPREVCHDEQVERQAPVKDEHRVAGTVAGAVVGGVIGNQIGDGKGKTIAKVVGIAGGAYAGNQIQRKMQEADTVVETERRCETVTESREQPAGYDVTYTYAGRTATVRMSTKPGATLPVKNGQVVTN